MSRLLSSVLAVTFALLAAQPAAAQFTSNNVDQHSWLTLGELGASSGNDCWGYVSPSGREYALMGVFEAMVVVEITNPASPVIIASVAHSGSSWGDMKTYQTYVYVVNESGGGFDIVDLSDVDNGNVTLVQTVTTGGMSSSHNVAIDETSGFLYLCGSNLAGGRLQAWDLSDPENPTIAGSVSAGQGATVHDAQIVTFTSGPNAGKQIAFAANGGIGLDIYDVTDKGNMFRLSRSVYPNLAYAHQCWLSDDGQYLYLNDELDGINETVIFDVSDLSNPFVANTYDSGVPAEDHNLYIKDGFMFEAEYRAGLRIFCLTDPVNPVQVGWYDTHPESDANGTTAAWSCYPYFPSGTVIVSDTSRGLFVLDPSAALIAGALEISYPSGRPDLIDPAGGTLLQITVDASCGATTDTGTALLHYDEGGGFQSVPMSEQGGNSFSAVFPATTCGATVQYYVSVGSTGGGAFTDPAGAPGSSYSTLSAAGINVVLADDFEADLGWVATNGGATSGDWQRGVPIDDPDWAYDPSSDADGSGQCWLTENLNNPNYPDPSNTDVDAGSVTLTSPLLDLSGENASISYDYYLRLTDVEGGVDAMIVEASENSDAGPWVEVARHDTNGGANWRHNDITPVDLQSAGVTPTPTMKFRFRANDADPQSIVEAGLDAFKIVELNCDAGVLGDLDGDGIVGINDFLQLLGDWGPCDQPCPPSCVADLDNDCTVGINDFLLLLANWT